MATLEKAIEIAARAHAGVADDQGEPYLLHPIRVMLGVEGETARIVAALHDVVEDADVTFDDLTAEGFSAEVLAALKLVTHEKGQSYGDYVIACKTNDVARSVKLSDLRDNSSMSRILLRPHKLKSDVKRVRKYLLSYRYLTDELTEAEYREAMS